MEPSNPHLKVASIISAVLLVGAFVSYRAGAFQLFAKPEPESIASPTPESPPGASEEQSPQTYLYSSRSAPAFTPVVPANPNPAGSSPTYMGGSKYIVVAPPPADPPKPDPPTFLGGSKSKVIFSPAPPKPGTQPTTTVPNQPRP